MSPFASYFSGMSTYAKTMFGALAAVVVLALLAPWWHAKPREVEGAPTNFFECARVHKVAEGFPRRCTTNSGEIFYDYTATPRIDLSSQIALDHFMIGSVVDNSPLVLTGLATPEWLKGAQVTLQASGRIIARATLSAVSDALPVPAGRMPFSISLSFSKQPTNAQGALVIKKTSDANASSTLVVPVVF